MISTITYDMIAAESFYFHDSSRWFKRTPLEFFLENHFYIQRSYFREYFLSCFSAEAVTLRGSLKKSLLQILQNSQENTCKHFLSFFNKVVVLRPVTLLNRNPGTGVFL